MTGLQIGGVVLGVALAGVIREVVRPRYQAWVVRRVQSGRWTQLEAQRFDHRVDMAIWLPFAFIMGMGAAWWIWIMPLIGASLRQSGS